MKIVSAADANRQFSSILRDVRGGATVVVTSRGEPVAKIVPVDAAPSARAQREGWNALFDRLDSQPAMNLGRFNRDELYDRDR